MFVTLIAMQVWYNNKNSILFVMKLWQKKPNYWDYYLLHQTPLIHHKLSPFLYLPLPYLLPLPFRLPLRPLPPIYCVRLHLPILQLPPACKYLHLPLLQPASSTCPPPLLLLLTYTQLWNAAALIPLRERDWGKCTLTYVNTFI